MSSRIRGRRYRNIDPDERYGFTVGSSSTDQLEAAMVEPIVEVISLDGTPLEGTTVMVDGTSVTMGTGVPGTVILEPRAVTGPSQAEG